MYQLDDYDYHLPPSLIAQQPMDRRDQSRLLCLDRTSGCLSHRRFHDLPQYLQAGDVLVLNNTRVVPARLYGHKDSGGKVEILILDWARGAADKVFECLVKASKRPKPGIRLIFEGGIRATVLEQRASTCLIDFSANPDLDTVLERKGHIPLPPYIQRGDAASDRETYQTVYASAKGAVAAPTAGLHFTVPLLETLKSKGVRLAFITLHVGYGTFVPVRVEDIRQHRMHSEWFALPGPTADLINSAKMEGRRVVAVGTTCVRTLEFCSDPSGLVREQNGLCDLFIYPGYAFKVVDGMLTNFHLPKSTLMMLVSAFAGRKTILKAYAEAVAQEYRFFSYGDAMFIV
ncbi:MAG: tRNA preQ1(34) S-adenosylmethionine ribosyltransferase-isomerase QueA [Desulfosarcinaceae bacterium]